MKFSRDLGEVVSALRSGGVVVYPTETSYGIGCDATNVKAVAKVFAIKHRPEGKGMTVLLSANDTFGESFAVWNSSLRDLAEKHWPGALNIILPVVEDSKIAPQCFTNNTIAVRRSSHPIVNAMADALGCPLVSTSANISGESEIYSAQEIFDRFAKESEQPDIVFDAGEIPHQLPSTVVVWNEEKKKIVVLRQGEITIAE